MEEPGVFEVWQPSGSAALLQVRSDYETLLKTEAYDCCKTLRNNDIGHLLHGTWAPTVEYSDIYTLHDAAEPLVIRLCQAVRIAPMCVEKRAYLELHAKLFWDTHFSALP